MMCLRSASITNVKRGYHIAEQGNFDVVALAMRL